MASIDLIKLGIVRSKKKTDKQFHFEKVLSNVTFENYAKDFSTPSEFVRKFWVDLTKHLSKDDRNTPGMYFEWLIAVMLVLEKIGPFYPQATVPLVPNVEFDFVMYSEKNDGPIVLSLKTSLRERYKQADLEAYALKNVFRNATSYLITLDKDLEHVVRVQGKIRKNQLYGLDKVVHANSAELDNLVKKIRGSKLVSSPTFQFVKDPDHEVQFHGPTFRST